jgi:dTDP-4-dehydrorhamnose reductase
LQFTQGLFNIYLMKVYIIGDTGLLGVNLVKFLKKKKINLILNSQNKFYNNVDFTKKKNVLKLLDKVRPDIIINLAALANVDICEKNKIKAKRLNFDIPNNIKQWMNNNPNTFLIHLSTDQLYSGQGPHNELSVNVINNYSKTKLLGEECLVDTNTTILRTNFFGVSFSKRKSFTDWIYYSVKKNFFLYLFKNIKFSPLSINSLCKYLFIVMKKKIPGIYNLGSKRGVSKSNFAILFLKELNIKKFNHKIVNFKQNFAAKRSLDMRMNVNKFEKNFKIKLPTCSLEIRKEARIYKMLYKK